MEVDKMANCSLCGKKIRAYLDICENCSSKMESDLFGFQDKIQAGSFIREMGINV